MVQKPEIIKSIQVFCERKIWWDQSPRWAWLISQKPYEEPEPWQQSQALTTLLNVFTDKIKDNFSRENWTHTQEARLKTVQQHFKEKKMYWIINNSIFQFNNLLNLIDEFIYLFAVMTAWPVSPMYDLGRKLFWLRWCPWLFMIPSGNELNWWSA